MILRTKVSAKGEQRRSRTKVEEISIGSRTLNGDGVPIMENAGAPLQALVETF